MAPGRAGAIYARTGHGARIGMTDCRQKGAVMGFMDDAKDMLDKAEDMAADNKDKIKDGLDKAGDMAKDKIGYDEQVDKAVDMASDQVDKLEKD